MNLGQFENAVAAEIGMSTTDEKTTIDDAINVAVQRVLEDTHCYVQRIDYTSFSATATDYTLDSGILEIVELFITSTGTPYSLERLSAPDLLERRRVGQPGGSPTQWYAVTGANLIMFWPGPGVNDTLSVYAVPVPTALSATSDDPSTTTLGGIPQILHEAILFYALSKLASGDDDQSSAQGQRYRDWYAQEIVRYKTILRKKGGTRNARVVVNDKRRRRSFHTNDIYPAQ